MMLLGNIDILIGQGSSKTTGIGAHKRVKPAPIINSRVIAV